MRRKGPARSAARTHDAELLARFTTPMSSVEERKAAGKALRAKVPHERHAEYRPAPKRADRDYDALVKAAKSKRVPSRQCRNVARGNYDGWKFAVTGSGSLSGNVVIDR